MWSFTSLLKRGSYQCFLHQFHLAFCPSSLFVLAMQMWLFTSKSVDCSASCCLWSLTVLWSMIVRFYSGKALNLATLSYDCSSSSMLWSSLLSERLSTAFVFPANCREGHVTWHFPRLPFAGRRFYSRTTFFPFRANVKTWVFEAHVYRLFLHFDCLFYNYASFIILLLQELLVKLNWRV